MLSISDNQDKVNIKILEFSFFQYTLKCFKWHRNYFCFRGKICDLVILWSYIKNCLNFFYVYWSIPGCKYCQLLFLLERKMHTLFHFPIPKCVFLYTLSTYLKKKKNPLIPFCLSRFCICNSIIPPHLVPYFLGNAVWMLKEKKLYQYKEVNNFSPHFP